MKKNSCIFFAVVFVLGLFMVTANAQATEVEGPKIQLSGLIEVGAAWIDYDHDNPALVDEDASDLCLTTVELTAEAEVNEWVNVVAVLLYEDATSFEGDNEETDVEIDEAIVTIGNTQEYPLYVSAGKMYVPFGALLTHFPDDPLMNVPVTLVLGETLEKALLVGVEYEGFSVSGYIFNGDIDETGEDNHVESYGFDANYSVEDLQGLDLLIGVSYISNIADSDGLEEALDDYAAGTDEIRDYIDGFDAYLHVGFADFFVDAEYMTALDDFAAGELAPVEVEPEVLNIEAGYNLDWGKNLEIVLKYASSDECGEFIPEDRYGICLNQNIFEDVIVSLAYLNDEYVNDDEADIVYAQIAVEF